MIEIKEGLDLDRAVAEAVGLVCTHRVLLSESDIALLLTAGGVEKSVPI